MITISRLLARQLRVVFSRALGVTPRSNTPNIQFRADEHGLSINVVGHNAAVSYHHPAPASFASLSVPFELLKRCEGTKHEHVTIELQDAEIVARWSDAGIPQIARFPVADSEDPLPLPDAMQPNDSDELLTALGDAVETTDREATRYALNCIRLRGSDGQVAGTDGRQLFIQDGFSFPWEGDLIVPACRVFTCADLNTGSSAEIGSTDNWAVIRSGPWTIHLRIEKEGRFPNVDSCIPQPDRTQSTLRMSGSDAAFLRKALRRIPSGDELNSPVTVDLNGSVSIRGKSCEQPTPTELVLTGSRRDGDALRFNTNREYLSRAVRLGFRDVELSGPESPACCRDGRRVYVWSLLGKEGAILADPGAVRIESPADSNAAQEPRQRPRRRTDVRGAVSTCSDRAREESQAASMAGLLKDAEALEASLREMLSRTSELILGLKRQRKPSGEVRPAVEQHGVLQGNAA